MTKGAFQELDAVTFLTPHTKLSVRPSLDSISHNIQNAYRSTWYGRPGTSFVDLPADLIQGTVEDLEDIQQLRPVAAPPAGSADALKLFKIAALIKSAEAPLVVVGKGAAYARAEGVLRQLIDSTHLPFLPSPMGKGVVPDSHDCNTASARSTALQHADVVLMLGARLNWIFHFGQAPKWNPNARFIQVDVEPTEIGSNGGDAELGIVGDVNIVVQQLSHHLGGWKYPQDTAYIQALAAAKEKNEQKATKAASLHSQPLKFAHAFDVIRSTLDSLSPASEGSIVYVSEGANTMDISRSSFPVEQPRLRLDAGTYATMGVGMGYAIAAHEAYNSPHAEGYANGRGERKKIVCLEGDSAFGFSAMEIETMARYQMDCLIFVMNNGGVYHGDSDTADEWLGRQQKSLAGSGEGSLRSTSLGWETRYEMLAEAVGGKGYLVRTPEELAKATREGFEARVPVIVNIMIESGKGSKLVRTSTFRCKTCIADHRRALDGRPAQRNQRKKSRNCRLVRFPYGTGSRSAQYMITSTISHSSIG